ncbi:MAG: hypothetical protein M3O62_19700 [Pseudomonadota bacterium]|nr:hypothetical protein [Pseudomonadota bacterium]
MIRTGIFFALAMALLMGLWQLMRPLASTPQSVPVAVVSATASPSAGIVRVPADVVVVAAPKRFMLQLGAPGTAEPLQVQVGDEVELSITTSEDDELHLHGYDLALPLRAGEPGTLRFVAEHAGRFELELHHAHAELGVLEVSPRY